VRLFEEYIALAYSTRLAEYAGESFKVTGSRPDADGAIVQSQILRPAGQTPIKVDWRLVGRNGAYKISDVSVDGISMAVTQRSEFASVIQHNGGQVEGLIAMLRQKTQGSAAR
jgi:phospholipid transport system substrate-binding protein